MTNIVDFNNSDGLPPGVIQKLNHNFWSVVQKIIAPEVVVVAGATEPNPRTNETLFYNTATGDLYIWSEYNGTWGWEKIDIGYIHVDSDDPYNASIRPQNPYIRKNEFMWISTNPNDVPCPIWFWGTSGSITTPGWVSFGAFVVNTIAGSFTSTGVFYSMMDAITNYSRETDWTYSPGFCNAVKAIIANPGNYPLS